MYLKSEYESGPLDPENQENQAPGGIDVPKMAKGMQTKAHIHYQNVEGDYKAEKRKNGKERCKKLRNQLQKDYKAAQKNARKADFKLADAMMKKDYSEYTVIFGTSKKKGKKKGKSSLLQGGGRWAKRRRRKRDDRKKKRKERKAGRKEKRAGRQEKRKSRRSNRKKRRSYLRTLRKWKRDQLRHLRECKRKVRQKLRSMRLAVAKAKFKYKWLAKALVMMSPILAKQLSKMKFGDDAIDETAAETSGGTTVDGIAKLADVKAKIEFQTYKKVHPLMQKQFKKLMSMLWKAMKVAVNGIISVASAAVALLPGKVVLVRIITSLINGIYEKMKSGVNEAIEKIFDMMESKLIQSVVNMVTAPLKEIAGKLQGALDRNFEKLQQYAKMEQDEATSGARAYFKEEGAKADTAVQDGVKSMKSDSQAENDKNQAEDEADAKHEEAEAKADEEEEDVDEQEDEDEDQDEDQDVLSL